MLEVTCFHCGQAVQISPDVERCSVCGTNLRKSISREHASSFFYERAADMAGAGDVLGALQVVQRGLPYVHSSELNLLGAILCKRLGRLEEMRHHVAAIPVDDPLRGEGEWLLRSNQARQRATPEAARNGKAPVAIPVVPDSDALPMLFDEVVPARRRAPEVPVARLPVGLLWLMLLALVAGGGWLAWQNPPAGLTWLPGAVTGASDDAVRAAEQMILVPPAAAEVPAAAPAVEPTAALQAFSDDGPAATSIPADAPAALPLPTPTIALDLAQAPGAGQRIATSSEDAVEAAANNQPFDWPAYLRQAGRADLAELPVLARFEGAVLVLEGTVARAEERAAVEALARLVPGAGEVSIINVRVRVPAEYTVVEGDTLWDISVRLYGTADQVEELFAANQDQMANAGALRVGMVLRVPAIE